MLKKGKLMILTKSLDSTVHWLQQSGLIMLPMSMNCMAVEENPMVVWVSAKDLNNVDMTSEIAERALELRNPNMRLPMVEISVEAVSKERMGEVTRSLLDRNPALVVQLV